jgi:hypothetical protein
MRCGVLDAVAGPRVSLKSQMETKAFQDRWMLLLLESEILPPTNCNC